MKFNLSGPAFIIAEAGTCHASVNVHKRLPGALRYADAAKAAGADAVKYQMFGHNIEQDMFCWIDGDSERSVRWKNSILSLGRWWQVKNHCDQLGIMFLASAFQYSTVAWLKHLGVAAYKVASRAARDFPYDAAPGPFLVSNGMYPVPVRPDVVPIQCEANYPSTAFWRGDMPGFSDHSGTPDRAVDAIKRGCLVIEVHFHINESEAGPDLPASLDLSQLRAVCAARDLHTQGQHRRTA